METRRAIVDGLVQGVCFRAWARDLARSLGLAGWVRNLPDGRVEILVQGSPPALADYLAQLEYGSPLSRVSRVEHALAAGAERFESFEIRY